MDALGFVRELKRMCRSYYDAEKGYCSDDCPAQDFDCMSLDQPQEDIERIVKVVEKWSQENNRKTRQSVFLEQWSNAKVFVDGVLDFCPLELDECYPCQSTDIKMRCQSCRREFWMQEVE